MKTLFRKFSTLALFLLGFAGFALGQQGQNSITQTTLSAAVFGPAGYSGTTSTISQTVTLAACTGITAPTLPGTPVSVIYVDREAMGIMTWNPTACSGAVLRGYLGTVQAPHSSGTMVLMAPVYQTNLAFGGNPVPSGLFGNDPPIGATCSAGVPTNLWINVITGNQWLCSTITNTWVPGFINQIGEIIAPTTAVASAASITPSGPLFHLTGTTSIVTITQPLGCNATLVGGCQFTAICDGLCAWTAAGNIAVAGTKTTAGTMVTFIWDAKNLKWVPSTLT